MCGPLSCVWRWRRWRCGAPLEPLALRVLSPLAVAARALARARVSTVVSARLAAGGGSIQRTTTKQSKRVVKTPPESSASRTHALHSQFCHRITQRVLQPQHGVLWLCMVPAASSRTAASFSSRSALRDETWSSVELIVSLAWLKSTLCSLESFSMLSSSLPSSSSWPKTLSSWPGSTAWYLL